MRKSIIIASVLVFLVLLGSFCYNKICTSVWAAPFIHGREVAVFKATSRSDSAEKYYTVFANGSVAEITSHDLIPNPLYYNFDYSLSQTDITFTSVDIEHAIPTEYDENMRRPTKYVYIDAQGNEYNEFPRLADDKLLAIQDDLFERLSHERWGSKQFFRDRDTIFVVRLNDCGWTSYYQIYTYDINTHKFRSIAIISTAETIDWIYAK